MCLLVSSQTHYSKYTFSQILIFAEKLEFCYWQQDRLTFFIFEKCLSSMQVWIITVKVMFHEKKKKSTKCSLQFKQWHKCNPLRQPSHNMKKTYTEEVWFNKTNFFYCFIKDIFNWNVNFCFIVFSCACVAVKNTVWYHCFDSSWSAGSHTQRYFRTINALVDMVKKVSNSSRLLWKSFWSGKLPERVLRPLLPVLWTTF